MCGLHGIMKDFESLRNGAFSPLRLSIPSNFHNCRHIATPIAIIRRTPDCHKRLVKMVFASLHDELMGPGNELQGVDMMKVFRDAFPKEISGTPGAHLPRPSNVFWIAPYQIAKGSLVGDLLIAINGTDLIEGPHVWTETAVDAKDLFVNESGQAETVKALDAVAPDRGVAVFAQAFVVKSVDLCDLTAL